MGWPVGHSRSPLIHSHWIAEHGLSGAYVLLPVQPVNLTAALRGLPVLGFAGCNLTIPHKVDAINIVDQVEPLALRIGAVNTIVVQADGSLLGRNTDAFGFIESLKDAHPGWQAHTGPAVVIGAGGAARAVIAGLLDAGATEVRVANRSAAKAIDLAQEFGPSVHPVAWEKRHAALAGCNLDDLPVNALVADIVYAPLQTPLLKAAQMRGNATVNGLGMLVHQARAAFESWFGVLPTASTDLFSKLKATL